MGIERLNLKPDLATAGKGQRDDTRWRIQFIKADGEQIEDAIRPVLRDVARAGDIDILKMEPGASALMRALMLGLTFPAEAVDHHRKAARIGQESEIADPRHRVLQTGRNDFEVGRIFRAKEKITHLSALRITP